MTIMKKPSLNCYHQDPHQLHPSNAHLWHRPSTCPAANLESVSRNPGTVCRSLHPSWWYIHLGWEIVGNSFFAIFYLQSSCVLYWAALIWNWASVDGIVGLGEGWYADVAGEVVDGDLDVGDGGVDGGVVEQPAELERKVAAGCDTRGVNSIPNSDNWRKKITQVSCQNSNMGELSKLNELFITFNTSGDVFMDELDDDVILHKELLFVLFNKVWP